MSETTYAIGEVDGSDGERLVVGVEGGTVAVYIGAWQSADGCRLNAAQAEEFGALFVHAAWQAGRQDRAAEDVLKNGDRVLVIPLDVKGTVILTRLDGTVAVVADNATRPSVWERGEVRYLPEDDPVGEMLAPITDVPMVCTTCRKPVIRSGQDWVHLHTADIGACIRPEGRPVRAMVAAGNEDVPRTPQKYICTECGYSAPQAWQSCPQCRDPGAVCATQAEIDMAEAELRDRGHL